MMYFEPHHPIQDIKTDLEKLLGLSSLGWTFEQNALLEACVE
jgi:hypothetical protein